MSDKFCDNKLCSLNELPRCNQTQVLRNDHMLTITSHTINGVNFCACCLNAIKLSLGESLEVQTKQGVKTF